jgi:uncharacterized Zn finger protein
MRRNETSLSEFERLQQHWYQKLKDSGFEDIELPSGGLKKDIQNNIKRRAFEEQSSRQDYYSQVDTFLRAYQFDSFLDEAIWTLFSEGKSIRETAKLLSSTRGIVAVHLKKLKVVFDFYMWVISGSNQD